MPTALTLLEQAKRLKESSDADTREIAGLVVDIGKRLPGLRREHAPSCAKHPHWMSIATSCQCGAEAHNGLVDELLVRLAATREISVSIPSSGEHDPATCHVCRELANRTTEDR